MMTRYICSFFLHARGKDSPSVVTCRVKWNGSKSIVQWSLGFVADPEKWQPEAQRCKAHSFHGPRRIPAARINREIEACAAMVEDAFRHFEELGVAPSTDQLRDELRRRRGAPVKGTDALAAWDEYISSEGDSLPYSSLRNLRSVQYHLRDFRDQLNFDDITVEFLEDFKDYLTGERHLVNASALKMIKGLKRWLRWCDERGLVTHQDALSYSPELTVPKGQVIFLEWDELMKLWDYEPQTQTESLVRDIFCLCAFTSLRFSDAMNLCWANVARDVLHVTMVKTTDYVAIDLNDWSREILRRYEAGRPEGGKIFPAVTNQTANRTLKEMCRKLGFDRPIRITKLRGSKREDVTQPKWELIGTHAARRTFVCTAIQLGIPVPTIMEWTGHTSYATMRPYIGAADSARASAMALFNKRK